MIDDRLNGGRRSAWVLATGPPTRNASSFVSPNEPLELNTPKFPPVRAEISPHERPMTVLGASVWPSQTAELASTVRRRQCFVCRCLAPVLNWRQILHPRDRQLC